MMLIMLIVFVIMMILSIRFRTVVLHPISCIKYALTDVYYYFKYHQYDVYNGGHLNSYVALFGGGKTLTDVHDILSIYNRYNNKRVFDKRRGEWVVQKILVISNVEIKGIENYQYLDSLKRAVECAKHNEILDKKYGTRTIAIINIDEASVMLNSRQFKSNIDYGFLNTLLCSRHYLLDLFYTTQKQNLADKLLRDVTQKVIHCEKKWRLVVNRYYDADDVEKVGSLSMLQPLAMRCFIATNRDFEAYDTYAVVEELEKATMNGGMLSEAEILANRGTFYSDVESVQRPSKRLKNRMRIK